MSDVIMAALNKEVNGNGGEQISLPMETLVEFHRCLGYLNYDAVERLVKDPSSGIELVGRRRGSQSGKDTGEHSPISRVCGVICSGLKGPITPRDRLGNRCMVNFVDHKSNYCRVFLAKTKKQFERFLVFLDKRFNYRIWVEYQNVDLFCKKAGVARRRSEANNQVSNGKAERMHRTIINTAKSIVFACGLPLSVGGRRAIRSLYPKQITNQRKSGEGVAVEDAGEADSLAGRDSGVRRSVHGVQGSAEQEFLIPRNKK
ncbi:hypothetical protein PHPALM_27859 [Phytophthora palmivora]|uniref:Uncharacterized protein n=1 Tax=Phytophthora palmivora TaxID=4796 RepID=A0A2P4XBK8_9STRA|nr:hypothetical protein PHPALM_27859 [Phytophthora palmivora]